MNFMDRMGFDVHNVYDVHTVHKKGKCPGTPHTTLQNPTRILHF